jgi:hypothetical protein
MTTNLKIGDTVRIKKYVGTINEYAKVVGEKRADGKYWVANMNMPFCGSVSGFFKETDLEKVEK